MIRGWGPGCPCSLINYLLNACHCYEREVEIEPTSLIGGELKTSLDDTLAGVYLFKRMSTFVYLCSLIYVELSSAYTYIHLAYVRTATNYVKLGANNVAPWYFNV